MRYRLGSQLCDALDLVSCQRVPCLCLKATLLQLRDWQYGPFPDVGHSMITRRLALSLIGAFTAFMVAPLKKVAAVSAPSLLKTVEAEVAKLSPADIKAALDGVYAKIFERKKATVQIETVAHVSFAARPDDRRLMWNFEPKRYNLGFEVVGDDDPRAGQKTVNGAAPWRLSELPRALKTLLVSMRQQRETDAALILNQSETYDPTVSGDGRPLVSGWHPHSEGHWANAFYAGEHAGVIHMDLNQQTLKKALERIENEWVDNNNLKIVAKGRLLVVPPALANVAAKMDFPYVVWDYLEDRFAWFVLTSVDGFVWFEREPCVLDVWYDNTRDLVLVSAYERRCFGCHDPRAVFGSLPAA